jgi:hypothetical protein
MELLFYFLMIASVILLILDIIFVWNSALCPEFLSPNQTFAVFLLIAAAGMGMAFFGFNIETILLPII